MSYSSRQREFWAGARATIPLIVGAIPFGIILGAAASTGGLSPAATLGLSALVYAGSAQFIGAGLAAQGVATGIVILTTFVVNLRHALYAATLAPYTRHLPQRWLLPMGFWLTDETFAVAIARYVQPDETPDKHWFYLGSAIAMYLNWQLCTLIGVLAGQVIGAEDAQALGLDFAMIVTFIGLVVPMIRNRPALAAVIAAGLAAALTYHLPNGIGLMIAALVGVAAGLVAEAWGPQSASPVEEAAP